MLYGPLFVEFSASYLWVLICFTPYNNGLTPHLPKYSKNNFLSLISQLKLT